jgi:hypothetical protein
MKISEVRLKARRWHNSYPQAWLMAGAVALIAFLAVVLLQPLIVRWLGWRHVPLLSLGEIFKISLCLWLGGGAGLSFSLLRRRQRGRRRAN